MTTALELKNINFKYGDNSILENLSLQVKKGEIISILGPNGCGKSTLLNIISGFMLPHSGYMKILKNGSHTPTTLVFQDGALLDWKNVANNIGMSLLHVNKDEKNTVTNKYLKMLALDDHKDKFPHELSGGLRQRTAIGRALAPNPQLLLLDEPFSSLDWQSKEQLQVDLFKILKASGKSAIIVTHDLDEAILFSNRILLFSEGSFVDDIIVPLSDVRDVTLLSSPSTMELKKEVKKKYAALSGMEV